ncbi:MAG TPA: RlmE family RNA methyltransferase [Candidatus Acidoferrales bacterium]|nr:RlmE family RNA methyltransferase [Candidatus Acidoferrales bacterium]
MAYQRKDVFYNRAKRAGYRSRAAYKLEELTERYNLLRSGDHVVDLGAWPGGWLQVAAQRIGPRGLVVGVDLQKIDPLPGLANVRLIQGDILDPAIIEQALADCSERVDVIISDMAPKLSGIRDRDLANATMLAEATLSVARQILRPGGRLLLKLFMGPETKILLDRLRADFRAVRTTRPEATRRGSAEIYAIAMDSK